MKGSNVEVYVISQLNITYYVYELFHCTLLFTALNCTTCELCISLPSILNKYSAIKLTNKVHSETVHSVIVLFN